MGNGKRKKSLFCKKEKKSGSWEKQPIAVEETDCVRDLAERQAQGDL